MLSSNCRVNRTKRGSPGAGAPGQGVTARQVLNAAIAWWKIALPAGLLLAAAGAALAWGLFQPQYEAAAWLRIDEKPAFVAFESQYPGRLSSFMNTQVELLRSPLVLGAVVREPAIARFQPIQEQADPAQWLAKKLQIKPIGESELLKVSLATCRAEDSVRIVNAVVDAYFKLRSHDEAERAERVIRALEEERDRRVRELASLRADLPRTGGDAATRDPVASHPATDPAASQALADLQGRLINAEVEQEVLEAKVKAAAQSSSAGPIEVSEGSVDRAAEKSPEFLKLNAALVEKRERLHQIEARSARGEQDPLYRQLREEIAGDEQSLDRLRRNQRRQIEADMTTAAGKRAEEELSNLRLELEGRRVAAQLLRERYRAQLEEVKQPDARRPELASKRAELDRAQKVFELIAERVAKLRTEQRAPGRVSLLQRAELPPGPIEAFPLRIIALVCLAGLCLPFVAAVAWERWAGRVLDAESLEWHSDLALLAELPRLPSGGLALAGTHSRRAGQQVRAFEESIDCLSANLLLSHEPGAAKVFAVLSAARGEGRTSVAAQLAVSIARATGKPTLLIDGDMRSPAIHDLFDVCLEPGLAQVLAGEAALQDAVVPDATGHVDLLPAGTLGENPHRLLGSGAWQSLLQEASARYEQIIVDTPPLLAAGESLAMAKAADACVMCALRGASRIDRIEKARKWLQTIGARVAGIVLNGVSARQYSFRYGHDAARPLPPDAAAPSAKAHENTQRERSHHALCRW